MKEYFIIKVKQNWEINFVKKIILIPIMENVCKHHEISKTMISFAFENSVFMHFSQKAFCLEIHLKPQRIFKWEGKL